MRGVAFEVVATVAFRKEESVRLLQFSRLGDWLLVVFGCELFGDRTPESLLEEPARVSAGWPRKTMRCQSDVASG